MNRRRLGRKGERIAARYLKRHGLAIVTRNWRDAGGEIDLVARAGDTLVIVEVRTTSSGFAGGAAQTVGPDKARRLRRLAAAYRRAAPWRPAAVRIDVVAVRRRGLMRWEVRWYKRAIDG